MFEPFLLGRAKFGWVDYWLIDLYGRADCTVDYVVYIVLDLYYTIYIVQYLHYKLYIGYCAHTAS